MALASVSQPADGGPFYHGTRADLKVGDLLTAGYSSNYQSDLIMNHIYFTALVNGAGLAAALVKDDAPERVYIVEPMGSFEDDPNVTNKKFPGNPTRSYRTKEPLKIVGEVGEWLRQTPEQLQQWREKLAANNGEIIN
ncbi:NAD(+)--rifampin ADP-ribosyltransferase [Pedobacter suwonensis]